MRLNDSRLVYNFPHFLKAGPAGGRLRRPASATTQTEQRLHHSVRPAPAGAGTLILVRQLRLAQWPPPWERIGEVDDAR
jgi:hypothetical protein